jgi:hypothetical protein
VLDGADDYVDLPSGDWDDFGPEESFSVRCCFFVEEVLPGQPHIIGRYHPGNDDSIHILYGKEGAAGHVVFAVRTDYGGGAQYVVSDDPSPPGVWHEVCAVRDRVADELRLYVDGELAAAPQVDGFSGGFTQNHFVIGRTGAYDEGYFTGKVDRVEVWRGEAWCPANESSWGVVKGLYR